MMDSVILETPEIPGTDVEQPEGLLPPPGPPSTLAGDLEPEKLLTEVRKLLKPNERFLGVLENLDEIIAVQEMLMALDTGQFKQLFEKLGTAAAEQLSQLFCKAMELRCSRQSSEVSASRYGQAA